MKVIILCKVLRALAIGKLLCATAICYVQLQFTIFVVFVAVEDDTSINNKAG